MTDYKVGEIVYIWVIYGKIDYWSGRTTESDRACYHRDNWIPGISKVKITKWINDSNVDIEFLDSNFREKYSVQAIRSSGIVKKANCCEGCHEKKK